MNTWIKIDRFFAWVLLVVMILYFISGYGMTKNLIDASFAISLHNTWLPITGIVAFVVHGSFATRLAFIRWQVWNMFIKVIWALVFTGILVGFLYIELFYQKPIMKTPTSKTPSLQSVTTNKATTSTSLSTTSTSVASPTSTQQTFTKETLSTYNGKNGNPSYIAINGVVYDVSSLYINGVHEGCTAGQDVTDGFSAERKHSASMLTSYPIVGVYED